MTKLPGSFMPRANESKAHSLEAELHKHKLAMHEIDIIAGNTIPPDGKDAAFGALGEIIKILNPFRIRR